MRRSHGRQLRSADCRSEYNTPNDLSLCSNQYPESMSLPGRKDRMSVLVNVPVLDGVPEKDVAWNIAVDETNAKAMGDGSMVNRECDAFGR